MINQTAIFVDSFREALRQVDRAIAWGMGAGLSVFALSIASQGKSVEFSFGFGKFDGSFGFVLALAVYFILGFVGASTVERAGVIVQKLDLETRLALKTFPSVVTWKSKELRFLTAILPGLFVFAGFVYAHIRRDPLAPSHRDWGEVIMMAFILLMPYLIFAVWIARCHSFFPDVSHDKVQNKPEST
jgi:hypothetical protein